MDRPHSSIKLEAVIKGLVDFRKIYKGQIWLELFMLEGVNDSDEELAKFVEVIKEIGEPIEFNLILLIDLHL